MTDSNLRALERAAQTGGPEEKAAYDRARFRANPEAVFRETQAGVARAIRDTEHMIRYIDRECRYLPPRQSRTNLLGLRIGLIETLASLFQVYCPTFTVRGDNVEEVANAPDQASPGVQNVQGQVQGYFDRFLDSYLAREAVRRGMHWPPGDPLDDPPLAGPGP